MMDHENYFVEQALVPIGWEPLAECGTDRGEAIALCKRIRESGRDCIIVVSPDGWNTVWEVVFISWPYITKRHPHN